MSITVKYPPEWEAARFIEEYDNFVEKTGMTEYAFGYALAKTYSDITPAVIELFKFILANRYLFVKTEEAERC